MVVPFKLMSLCDKTQITIYIYNINTELNIQLKCIINHKSLLLKYIF